MHLYKTSVVCICSASPAVRTVYSAVAMYIIKTVCTVSWGRGYGWRWVWRYCISTKWHNTQLYQMIMITGTVWVVAAFPSCTLWGGHCVQLSVDKWGLCVCVCVWPFVLPCHTGHLQRIYAHLLKVDAVMQGPPHGWRKSPHNYAVYSIFNVAMVFLLVSVF